MNTWYERSGGYVIAIFIHAMIFSWLAVTVVRNLELTNAKTEVQITLDFHGGGFPGTGGAMLPGTGNSTPPELAMAPIAATGNDEEKGISPDELKELAMLSPNPKDAKPKDIQVEAPPEATPEPTPEAQVTPEPAPTPEPQATPAEQAEKAAPKELAEPKAIGEPLPESPEGTLPKFSKKTKAMTDQEKLERAAEEYMKIGKSQGSNRSALAQKVAADEIRVKGKKFLGSASSGGDTGAVRTFDLSGSPEIVKQIEDRYELRHIAPAYVSRVSSGFINQLQTNDGTYHSRNTPGRYEGIEIGPSGIAKLKMLELEALKANGFDPSTDRVLLIKFGIVHGENGWDLGVVDFKAEKMGD